MSSSPPVHYGATASLPYSDYNHEDDYLSVDAEEGRRRRDEEETTPTAPSSSTSSLMRQYQTSGYHSDSAIPTQSHMTPNRRRRTSSREMLDPAAEPLIGTDIDESDRERDGRHHHLHSPSMNHGRESYEDGNGFAVQSMLDFDQFRSPLEEWVQPRKPRWNRKVTRKKTKKPTIAVRKGRLAVYCIASELQTDQIQRYLLQRKKEMVPVEKGGHKGKGAGGDGGGGGYYGTNGGKAGSQHSYFAPPAPPTLSTTNSSSLLLPVPKKKEGGRGSDIAARCKSFLRATANAAVSGVKAVPPSQSAKVDTSDLVGLNWRDKNFMGVIYTTDDDGKCDPLEVKHIFCFPYGCTVFWGCTKEEEERFISMLTPFAVELVSDMEREESYDDFAYFYGSSPQILHYEITLTSNDPEEKLALSFSLAQSAKLFVFEDRVDGTITSTKHIPIHLAEFGKTNVSRKEISKLTGKVFLERNEINLHSDILDTPEWFWEADLWEPRYVGLCKYLDLPNRVNILNKRLDILRELLNVLETQLDNSHSTKVSVRARTWGREGEGGYGI